MAGKYFLIAVVFLLWMGRDACSGDSRHLSPGEMLEFSLLSLRDSYQQLSQENKRLLSETQIYQQNIQHLRNELDLLEKEKESFLAAGSFPEDTENQEGNRIVAHKPSQAVQVLRADIRRLQEQINSLSEKSLKKAFQDGKEALKREQVHLRQKLSALQAENGQLNKEFSSLREALEGLKRRPLSPLSPSDAGLSAP